MITDCYEKGHTPTYLLRSGDACVKCGEPLFRVIIERNGAHSQTVWHTQAELDRLWKGVDRMAQVLFFGTLVAVIVAVWIRVIFG